MDEDAVWALMMRLADCMVDPGWMVTGVGAAHDASSFSYTTGLTELSQPELVMVGLPPLTAHTLLNRIAARVKSGEVLSEGIDDTVLDRYSVYYLPAPLDDELMPQSVTRRLYSASASATSLQVVWPDKNGRFPWDPQCLLGGQQRLLGTMPADWMDWE